MDSFIYHVVIPNYWKNFEGETSYIPPTFEEEGFIHCCLKDQIEYVLSTYYKGISEIFLLKIDKYLLTSELKMEAANGQYFPHIYGPLNKDAIKIIETIQLLENKI